MPQRTHLDERTLTEIPVTVNAAVDAAEISAMENTVSIGTAEVVEIVMESASIVIEEDNENENEVARTVVEVVSAQTVLEFEIEDYSYDEEEEEDFKPRGGNNRATGTTARKATLPTKQQPSQPSPQTKTDAIASRSRTPQENEAKSSPAGKDVPKNKGAGITDSSRKKKTRETSDTEKKKKE